MFSNKLQTNPSSRPRHRLPLTVALSATLAFASVPVAGMAQRTAWAEDIDTNVQADAAQQEVERTAAEYDQAISRIDDLNRQIADNEARIAEIEETLPTQQERSSAAAVKLYKTQASTPGLLEMVLGSDNIVDFLTSLEYVSHIYSSNQAEIKRLGELKDELDQTHRDLSQAKKDADAEAANAEQALSAAQQARQEAQRKAQEEAARQAEEAAEAEAAKAEAAKEADKQEQADSASAPAAAEAAGGSSAGTVEAPTGQASATCSWRSGPAASTHIWLVRLWQARARCSPRPLGTTAWTRVGRPPSPTPKAPRACTAPAAATPGAGAAAAGEAGKRPSATTLPVLPAATATPSRWMPPRNTARRTGSIGTTQRLRR